MYKFFIKGDKNKEKIGEIIAISLEKAYLIASKIKNLSLKSFKKLFKVEEL
jgi:hypothetical protein